MLAALTLLACAAPAPSPCPQADPQVAAFCWMRRGAAAADAAAARDACSRAGDYEQDCRAMWVSQHLQSEIATEVLLATCGAGSDPAASDCAFQVIDARPEPDLLVQLQRCAERAGPFRDDCAIHALSRWRAARPSASEVRRVAAADWSAPGMAPRRAGEVIAAVVACRGVGDCGTHPALAPACRAALEELARTPSVCEE